MVNAENVLFNAVGILLVASAVALAALTIHQVTHKDEWDCSAGRTTTIIIDGFPYQIADCDYKGKHE